MAYFLFLSHKGTLIKLGLREVPKGSKNPGSFNLLLPPIHKIDTSSFLMTERCCGSLLQITNSSGIQLISERNSKLYNFFKIITIYLKNQKKLCNFFIYYFNKLYYKQMFIIVKYNLMKTN